MNKSVRFLPLILVTLFLTSSSVFSYSLEETFKKRIPVSAGGLLSVDNSNGSVEVVSWDQDEVEIIAHKKVNASGKEDAQRMMEKLEIRVREDGSDIKVETVSPRKYGRSGGFFNWIFDGSTSSYSVSYELRVPRRFDVNLESTNGNVEAREIDGRIRMETTNGKINASGIRGMVRCSTTNGSIVVRLDQVTDNDEMTFKSTNGSIKLYLPESYSGFVDLKTTNGRIDSEFDITEKYDSDKRKRIRGMIGNGDGSVTCKTTNGGIDLIRNN
jgi:DUF4097 and DUF4098 domain-containing protein YvlB